MSGRISMFLVALLVVGVGASFAAQPAAEAPPFFLDLQGSQGCGGAGVAAASAEELGLVVPGATSQASGTCGQCSYAACRGAVVGKPCAPGYWCIPATTNFCPSGPQNTSNWECYCASMYF